MTDVPDAHAFVSQRRGYLLIDASGDGHALEGTVDGYDAGKCAVAAFGKELGPGTGGGGDEGGEGERAE